MKSIAYAIIFLSAVGACGHSTKRVEKNRQLGNTKATGTPMVTRDLGMARTTLEELDRHDLSESVVFLFGGNAHARKDSERWMAWHVAKALPRLRSLDLEFSGGTAWNCSAEGCGNHELDGEDLGKEPFVSFATSSRIDQFRGSGSHDGIYYVGEIHASPPQRSVTP